MTPKLAGYVMVVGLIVVMGAQPAAAARPCKVPTGAHPSIQTAVDDVVCTKIHVASGTFSENVVINRDVTIRGAGQDKTIIDGADIDNVFLITAGAVTIDRVTIQHGRGFGPPPTDDGGGINVVGNGVTLTVKNSTFSDNHAPGSGGGSKTFA